MGLGGAPQGQTWVASPHPGVFAPSQGSHLTDGRLLQVKTPRQPAATHIELFSTKHPKPVPKTQAPLLSLWVRETEQPPPRGVALPGGPAAASAAAAVAVAATRRASIAAVVG